MEEREVLLGYGKVGDFGRFRAAAPLPCRRGDQLVVRTPRGLELGAVLCFVHSGTCDARPLQEGLALRYRIDIHLQDLALPAAVEDEASLTTCGSGSCGSGCGSCGSGGCSSCGHHATPAASPSELRR